MNLQFEFYVKSSPFHGTNKYRKSVYGMENQLRLQGGFNPHCGIYHRLEDVFYGIVVLTVVFASRSTGRPAGWPAAPGSSWSSHYYLNAPHPVKWFLIGGWEQLEREQATISPGHIPTLKIYNQRYYLKAWVTTYNLYTGFPNSHWCSGDCQLWC